MRKLVSLSLFTAILLASCGGNSNADKAQTSAAQEVAAESGSVYHVDRSASVIKWKAYHKGGFDPRFGTIESEGSLSIADEAIVSGQFTIDLHTLRTDSTAVDANKTGGKTAVDLDGHLKNEDFFDVEQYPTAAFAITSVRPFDPETDQSKLDNATNMISGNLTIKDKTVNVTFPAIVTIHGEHVHVQSQFTINRQDWGLTYGTDGDPTDWMISQGVDLSFDISAHK